MRLTFADAVTPLDILLVWSEGVSLLSLDMLVMCKARQMKQKEVSWLELIVHKIARCVCTTTSTGILVKNKTCKKVGLLSASTLWLCLEMWWRNKKKGTNKESIGVYRVLEGARFQRNIGDSGQKTMK